MVHRSIAGGPQMKGTEATIRAALVASLTGAADALAAANQLCRACVETLEVDGAAISLMYGGTSRGTFGSTGETSRRLDELQFTYGEGPCRDAVSGAVPVLVGDLDDPQDLRWPAFREAALGDGIRAVFAIPVLIASTAIGALDLYRHRTGALTGDRHAGGLFAAQLAKLPLLALLTEVDWDDAADGGDRWEQLASLERVEVYQATGMLIATLDVDDVEALALLRAYAFSHRMTASEVAYAIVERRLSLGGDHWGERGGSGRDAG